MIIHDFSYVFKRGERCGIVDRTVRENNIAKTNNERVKTKCRSYCCRRNHCVRLLQQDGLSQSYHGKRLIDIVKEQAEMICMENGNYISASQFLNHFGFSFNHNTLIMKV